MSWKFSPNSPKPGLQTLNVDDNKSLNLWWGKTTKISTEKMKAYAMAHKPQSLARKKINFNLHLHKTHNGTGKGRKKNEEQNLGLLLPKFRPKKRKGEGFLGCKVNWRRGEIFFFSKRPTIYFDSLCQHGRFKRKLKISNKKPCVLLVKVVKKW